MNYYLDFEAEMNANFIISIGCVKENGDTFYTLVNGGPGSRRTVKFTGITQEKMIQAPKVQAALQAFAEFVGCDPNSKFFVYGNCDRKFLETTLKSKEVNENLKKFYYSFIINNLHDITTTWTDKVLKLTERYEALQLREGLYAHNALDDAKMLKAVCTYMPVRQLQEAQTIPSRKPKATNRSTVADSSTCTDRKPHHQFQATNLKTGTVQYLTSTTEVCQLLYGRKNFNSLSKRQKQSRIQAVRDVVRLGGTMRKYAITK